METNIIIDNLRYFKKNTTRWVFVKYIGDETDDKLKLTDRFGNVIHVYIPEEYQYCDLHDHKSDYFGGLMDNNCYLFQIKRFGVFQFCFANTRYFHINSHEWFDESA